MYKDYIILEILMGLMHMEVFFGESLTDLLENRRPNQYKKRELFGNVEKYIESENDRRVCVLYGLCGTGKTTIMMQSMQSYNGDGCAYILCSYGDDMDSLNRTIDSLKGIRNIYIDEVTKLNNFVNNASVLADKHAKLGRKIILSGMDSYAFAMVAGDELYDRCHLIRTTYIPFNEHYNLLGKDIDNYIRHGGTLTDGQTFCNKDSSDQYLNSAIIKNIERSLAQAGRDGEFGALRRIYDNGDFTAFLQKIIERFNRTFLLRTATRVFKSEEILNNIRKSLDIKENLSGQVTQKEIEEAKNYLKWADVIYPIPKSDEVIFLQPGLRYSQLKKEIEALKDNKEFKKLKPKVQKFILNKLETDIMGQMLEDIVFYQQRR